MISGTLVTQAFYQGRMNESKEMWWLTGGGVGNVARIFPGKGGEMC